MLTQQTSEQLAVRQRLEAGAGDQCHSRSPWLPDGNQLQGILQLSANAEQGGH